METTSTLSNNIDIYFHRKLLESAEMGLVIYKQGREIMHPKQNGVDSYILKYGNLSDSTDTLTEGVVPTESTIDTNRYTITVNQYGRYITLSDKLQMTAIDDVQENCVSRLSESAARTMDSVIRNALVADATTNTQYSGSSNAADNDISSVADGSFVTQDIIKGVRLLKGVYAPTFADGYYTLILHPYVAADIIADTAAGGFIEINKYVQGSSDKIMRGEIGKAYGAKILESPNISSASNSSTVNVYRNLLLARDSFVVTKFDKNAVELIRKSAGSAGTADPLNQISTVGYKMHFGVKYVGGTFTNENGASPELCIQMRSSALAG